MAGNFGDGNFGDATFGGTPVTIPPPPPAIPIPVTHPGEYVALDIPPSSWAAGLLVGLTTDGVSLQLAPGQITGYWQYALATTTITQYWSSWLSWIATLETQVTAILSLDGGFTWIPIDQGSLDFADASDLSQTLVTIRLSLSRNVATDPSPVATGFSMLVTDSPDSTKRMLNYLPEPFRSGPNLRAHLRAAGSEIDLLYDALDVAAANLHPDTAGIKLSAWEALFGLIDGNANSMTDQQRQIRMVARLSGNGICNRQRLRNLVLAYEHNTVAIIEDPYTSTVWIRYIGTHGTPVLEADLQLSLRQQLPASVSPVFETTFITWDARDLQNRTWTAVDALGRVWDTRDLNP